MSSPIVDVFSKTVLLDSSIAASELFTATDPSDTIVSYFVQDFSLAGTSGYFTFDGVAVADGTFFEVAVEDLDKLRYVGGSQVGREKFRVMARNSSGTYSDPKAIGLLYSVTPNVRAPIATAKTFTLLADESIAATEIIEAFDPDGYPIESYRIRDRNVDQGYFVMDGVAKTQGIYFTIAGEDLSKLSYVSTGPTSSEQFDVIAFDGVDSSPNSVGVANTIANANRPVVVYSRATISGLDDLPLQGAVEITDADGSTMKRYRYLNTSSDPSDGNLVYKGVVQPRLTWIEVPASEIDQIFFDAANKDSTQDIRVLVYDGRRWSSPGTLAITSAFEMPPIKPEIVNDGAIYDDQLEELFIPSLFRKADLGDPYLRYQLYDANSDSESSRFELNNDKLAAEQVHEFSTAQLISSVRLKTGEFANRYRDDVYVRVDNGEQWSNWSRLTVRSEPELSRAEQSGNNWSDYFEVPIDSLGRYQLTYSFMQEFPDYETGEAVDDDPPEQFDRFTMGQRTATRQAFDSLEAVTNLKFVEVADTTTNVFGGRGGIFRFGEYGLTADDSNAQAFAFVPSTEPQAADIWINRLLIRDPSLAFGGPGFTTLTHEMMHALGFLHVYDGDSQVPGVLDNDNFSIMSGPGGSRPDGLNPTTPQLYDIESLQLVYGENSRFNAGNTIYDWAYFDNRDEILETIWDGGGRDTLSAAGTTTGAVLDISAGGLSSFNGFVDNIAIAYRAEIENAIGSDFDDELYGNHLNNILQGGMGNDLLAVGAGNDLARGGTGNDIYEAGVADGINVFDEVSGDGLDTVRITDFADLELTEDFVFRLAGTDLVVNLNLDGGDTQGIIRIKNQTVAATQIETLELNSVRIDLENLTSQATAANKKFMMLEDSSANGFLVAPV